jgi:hypothetical protein
MHGGARRTLIRTAPSQVPAADSRSRQCAAGRFRSPSRTGRFGDRRFAPPTSAKLSCRCRCRRKACVTRPCRPRSSCRRARCNTRRTPPWSAVRVCAALLRPRAQPAMSSAAFKSRGRADAGADAGFAARVMRLLAETKQSAYGALFVAGKEVGGGSGRVLRPVHRRRRGGAGKALGCAPARRRRSPLTHLP